MSRSSSRRFRARWAPRSWASICPAARQPDGRGARRPSGDSRGTQGHRRLEEFRRPMAHGPHVHGRSPLGSMLYAKEMPAAVPEPATLAIFGLGFMRHRWAAQRVSGSGDLGAAAVFLCVPMTASVKGSRTPAVTRRRGAGRYSVDVRHKQTHTAAQHQPENRGVGPTIVPGALAARLSRP